MRVINCGSAHLSELYGILCQKVLMGQKESFDPPFGLTYCEIPPTKETSPHDHYDGEAFYILEGSGEMSILSEKKRVGPGDLIIISNHSVHQLTNLSSENSLKFLSLYWDQSSLSRKLEGDHLILSAPPTPNGKLHVGHLSGPYLSADVLNRYLKLRGLRSHYACGADENQTYVVSKAIQIKQEPLVVAQNFTKEILEILQKFSATPDSFLLPHQDENYRHWVQSFFIRLVDKGYLVRKEHLYPFCEPCGQFLHESSVSGECPHCKTKTNGNGCESCGHYNDCYDLLHPHCNHCGHEALLQPSTRFIFSLNQWKEQLEEALSRATFPPSINHYIRGLLKSGLSDVTVSYPYSWGIPVPGYQGEIIYEWLEMAAAYLYHAQFNSPNHDYRYYWADSQNRTTLAFGFDNSYFYLALVPALMWAYDQEIHYPQSFLINYFYLLEGKKFSTSRQHAIWGDQILKEVKADLLRLYLASTRPELGESNFTLGDFSLFIKEWGLKKFDRLFQRITSMSLHFSKEINESDRYFLQKLDLLLHSSELAYHPSHFSLRSLFDVLEHYIQCVDSYLSIGESGKEINGRALKSSIQGLAQIIYPLCPEYGALLFAGVGLTPKWSHQLDLSSDTQLGPLPIDYFAKGVNHDSSTL